MRHFAPQAQADLDELVSWILDRGSAAAVAERLLLSVLEAADRLAARPLLGRRRPDLLPEPFRFWSIPRHSLLLIYLADPAAPTILPVLSTDRDLGSMLANMMPSPDSPGERGLVNGANGRIRRGQMQLVRRCGTYEGPMVKVRFGVEDRWNRYGDSGSSRCRWYSYLMPFPKTLLNGTADKRTKIIGRFAI